MKDKTMSTLSTNILDDFGDDAMVNCHELSLATNQPFVSLLELVSVIYEVQVSFPQLRFHKSLLSMLGTEKVLY